MSRKRSQQATTTIGKITSGMNAYAASATVSTPEQENEDPREEHAYDPRREQHQLQLRVVQDRRGAHGTISGAVHGERGSSRGRDHSEQRQAQARQRPP